MDAHRGVVAAGGLQKRLVAYLGAHRRSVGAWAACLFVTFLVYHLVSDGDFSFLLTLSSLVSLWSMGMVLQKSALGATGLSRSTVAAYVALLAARLCAIVPYEGYLPFDASGDWLYQTLEAAQLVVAVSLLLRVPERPAGDVVPLWALAGPAAGLALLIHPSLNKAFLSDVAWTFALYLEAVAMLPQLVLFRQERTVTPWVAHWLAGQGAAKVCSVVFWLSTHQELGRGYVGLWVLALQGLQLLIMADFLIIYVKALATGADIDHMLNAATDV